MVVNVMRIRPLLIISVLFCLILPIGVSAQEQASIDSLVSLLESTEGKEHLEILYALSENRWLAFEDRLSYTEDALNYAARSGEVRLLYDAHLHQGKVFSREAMDQKALESFEKALNISEESGDEDGIITSLFWIGKTYSWLRDPEMAAEYLNRTRNMAAENKNDLMETDALYSLGELNRRFREYEGAMAYYDTAYAMAEASGSGKMMAEINASQGMVMYYQGEFHWTF